MNTIFSNLCLILSKTGELISSKPTQFTLTGDKKKTLMETKEKSAY